MTAKVPDFRVIEPHGCNIGNCIAELNQKLEAIFEKKIIQKFRRYWRETNGTGDTGSQRSGTPCSGRIMSREVGENEWLLSILDQGFDVES